MTEILSHSIKITKSSDERSCPSEDHKRRIRKMIEVTHSTRYMKYVEGDDEPNEMALVPRRPIRNNFASTMAVIDNSMGNFQDTIGYDRARFGSNCRKMAQQYYAGRIHKMNKKVKKCAKKAAKYRKVDGKVKHEKRNMVKKLQDVLETSQKKREKREKLLASLMKKMAGSASAVM
uniref:Putative secreted protein n=1 Tax=Aedes albopictus TaxID=7160 RepID=A0A023EI63_AEDAL